MERKTFFEVFPDVKLNSELTEIFEQVEVTRITANRDRTKLRIYIESSRLINKPAILSVENELCRQLKMGKKISVQIMEHYSLSQQYTPKNLFDIYKDSIYTELSQKSALIATMYKKAQFQFLSDSALEMELETHLMTEERMNVIKNTIENIYNIRFNIPLKVVIKKVEAQKDKFKEQKEKKLRNEVEILMSRNKSNKPEKQEEKAQETPERPKIVKSTRSDNPDVVYGRDFEFDEETKIAELDRLRTSYNKMLLRLSESFEIQRQFTGNAAHELRTPLALIQAQLDLYHSTENDAGSDAAQETIQMITEQNERLSKLVKTLLDMSELQTIMRNDKIELFGLIEEVLTDLEPLALEKGIALIQEPQDTTYDKEYIISNELMLTGSDILIYRMLYNLVENAIKYNHVNGKVIVSAKQTGNDIVITIADTGSGIDEAFREKIFEPFFRVDKSRSREIGGVGLGLAMVREIVRAHDGKIDVHQNAYGGTTFEVKLGFSASLELSTPSSE